MTCWGSSAKEATQQWGERQRGILNYAQWYNQNKCKCLLLRRKWIIEDHFKSLQHCSVPFWVHNRHVYTEYTVIQSYFSSVNSIASYFFRTVKNKDVANAGGYLAAAQKGTRNVKHSPLCAVNLLLFKLDEMFFTQHLCIDWFLFHLFNAHLHKRYIHATVYFQKA